MDHNCFNDTKEPGSVGDFVYKWTERLFSVDNFWTFSFFIHRKRKNCYFVNRRKLWDF